MDKSFSNETRRKENVVRLEQDASFFFELAIRSLDRNQYKKALKYFRISVEKEPDNPVNYCNLAGLLSELGHFMESNEVLQQVLEQVDHSLHECLFYIANNYANMDDLERAEDCLLDYLDLDPQGEFAKDAEEMLYMVSYELGRSPQEQEKALLPPHLNEHDKAGRYMEEGKFTQAAKILEKLRRNHPDFLPALNNLTLAYFYMGELEKACSIVYEVLAVEPANLHAQCNLAILADAKKEKIISQKMINRLKKLIPLNPELLYKLATTLGILGEDQTAYQLFTRLFHFENPSEASMYHNIAAAAWNTGYYSNARSYWKKGAELHPDSEVFRYYLEQNEYWNVQDPNFHSLSYYYYIPFQETLAQLSQQKCRAFQLDDPLLKDSIQWTLCNGGNASKLQVIQMLEWLNDHESESFLRRFLIQPDEENELKKVALLILRQKNCSSPFLLWFKNQLIQLGMDGQEEVQNRFEVWVEILHCALAHMHTYTTKQCNHLKWLWSEFIHINGKALPAVRRLEAWAAALEYVIAKHEGMRLTQLEVAKKYQVSPSTVARHVSVLTPLMTLYQY